jgi:hypothetical protein
METAFAKIVSDMDGRDHIMIEGRIVSLRCDEVGRNNEMVGVIVSALRRGANEPIVGGLRDYISGGTARGSSLGATV